MTVAPLSPDERRHAEREAFLGRFRLACLCNPLEEQARIECPRCGAPLVRIVPNNVTGT